MGAIKGKIQSDRAQLEQLAQQIPQGDAQAQIQEMIDSYTEIEGPLDQASQDTGVQDAVNEAGQPRRPRDRPKRPPAGPDSRGSKPRGRPPIRPGRSPDRSRRRQAGPPSRPRTRPDRRPARSRRPRAGPSTRPLKPRRASRTPRVRRQDRPPSRPDRLRARPRKPRVASPAAGMKKAR